MLYSLWIRLFARTDHRTQGNAYLRLPVYYIIQDMMKDPDELPDEEIHRMRSGRVLSAGASVPVELGCITLPVHGFVRQPGTTNTILLGFLWRPHHIGLIIYYIHFQFLCPFWRMGDGAENPKLVIITWSFW